MIPSLSLEEFSCLHPPIEGFLEKTITTPKPLYFPETTSPRSKIFQKSKSQPRKNPITPWLSRTRQTRLKPFLNPGKTHANDKK